MIAANSNHGKRVREFLRADIPVRLSKKARMLGCKCRWPDQACKQGGNSVESVPDRFPPAASHTLPPAGAFQATEPLNPPTPIPPHLAEHLNREQQHHTCKPPAVCVPAVARTNDFKLVERKRY